MADFMLRIFDSRFAIDHESGVLFGRQVGLWYDGGTLLTLTVTPAPAEEPSASSATSGAAQGGDDVPAPPAAEPTPQDQSQPVMPRIASGVIGGGVTFGNPHYGSAGIGLDRVPTYLLIYADDLQSAIVVDPATRQLMPGGAGDYADHLGGRDDILSLSGDYSGGATLPGLRGEVDSLRLAGGSSYTLTANDGGLGAGAVLTVGGTALGAGDTLDFDGSAETDGAFLFHGGRGGDRFTGGDGDDVIYGLEGADLLLGGAGADVFAYTSATESSSAGYDLLGDFDPSEDRIDLPVTVTGFADAVQGGSLSSETFDEDLAAALGAFGPGQAILFAPDEGDLADRIFLIVDANGEEGYQPGEDYVFAIGGGPTLADLGGSTDIFI